MLNKFFPPSEMFKRNKSKMLQIVGACKEFKGENKLIRKKVKKIIESNPNRSYAIVFSPVNRMKLGLFSIYHEKAIRMIGEDLPESIPLSKIHRKYTYDFSLGEFSETSQAVDGFDFSEELLS